MKIGKTIRRSNCRLCGAKDLTLLLDLGYMPHAGDFLYNNEIGRELYYPLKIYRCNRCNLVQILDVIPQNVLFKNYHYLSSVSLSSHFKEYAKEMFNNYLATSKFAVEIGSNDGVLLKPLMEYGVKVLGVDPSVNVSKLAIKNGVNTITKEFTSQLAEKIVKRYGKANAIFANNVLAHIDDINDVFKGVEILLDSNGIMVAEIHYFPELIKKNQYDFFYNEHLCYYTLNTFSKLLSNHGLTIFDAKKIQIHSGSIRVYIKFKNNRKYKVSNSVKRLLNDEKRITHKELSKFITTIDLNRNKLIYKLNALKKQGYKIVGYGASGRANTLLNYCEIDGKLIDYIIDKSPERAGKYTPGTHIKIVKPDVFRKDKTLKYVLLLAWNYKEDIIRKEKKYIDNGGKFIIPLPKVHII